jgi:dUTP pyrophosphatase
MIVCYRTMNNSILEDFRQPKMCFEKLHQNTRLPQKAHPKDEGWDLFSIENSTIPSRGSYIFKTGLKLAFLDEGYWLKIESRSGLAFKNDIIAFQGVIDNEYRGEIGVKLFNLSEVPYDVKIGDRIAQLTIHYSNVDFGVEWGKVIATSRHSNGFGSTGR